MAKTVGISISSVQRIWQVHGLQPHRVRRFKLSKVREAVERQIFQMLHVTRDDMHNKIVATRIETSIVYEARVRHELPQL